MKKLVIWLGLVGSMAALGLSAVKFEWPSNTFWADKNWLLMTFAVVSAITPLTQTGIVQLTERRRLKALEQERSVKEFLTGALLDIARHDAGIDCTKVGIHAFLVKRKFMWSAPFPWWRQIQIRIARVKLTFNPPPSGITWTKGKGVIGRCWTTRDNHFRNLREWFEPYMNATREQWNALSEDTRYGLTYEEFGSTKGHYGIVAAVPMLSGNGQGKYIGCVSFDLPSAATIVDEPALTDRLRACARMVEVFLAQA